MSTVGYIRVSTIQQNTQRQEEALQHADKLYVEKASGKNKARPELEACLEYMREGDTLLVYSTDRLGRDFLHMIQIVDQLLERGINVKFLKESFDLQAGESKKSTLLPFRILCAVADAERERIKENQREGIDAALARGVKFGRQPKLTKSQEKEIVQACSVLGHNKADIARSHGISRQTLYRILKDAA